MVPQTGGTGELEEVVDRTRLRALDVRGARVEPEHVTGEVGVGVRVGVARGVRERVGHEALPVVRVAFAEHEVDTIGVALAAGEGGNDEVRRRDGVVTEVVEAEIEVRPRPPDHKRKAHMSSLRCVARLAAEGAGLEVCVAAQIDLVTELQFIGVTVLVVVG